MKAYKASYNGVCRDFKYEVGQTYEITNIKICKRGFHACYKMVDTLNYYDYNEDFVLFEVELLGNIIEENNKVVTDKIKIVRVVPLEEYNGFKVDTRGNLLYYKDSGGYELWKEYDERNNRIHYKSSNRFEEWKEYNLNNKCIYRKDSTGLESWYEYDEHNNLIHYKHSDGYEVWRKYDSRNNIIHTRNSYGDEWSDE